MVHFVEVFLTFSLSPFAMTRESSRLETLFDKQTSSSRGYVTEANKIEEIVREWELQTKSSFTLFTAPKRRLAILCRGLHLYIVTGAESSLESFSRGGGGGIRHNFARSERISVICPSVYT